MWYLIAMIIILPSAIWAEATYLGRISVRRIYQSQFDKGTITQERFQCLLKKNRLDIPSVIFFLSVAGFLFIGYMTLSVHPH